MKNTSPTPFDYLKSQQLTPRSPKPFEYIYTSKGQSLSNGFQINEGLSNENLEEKALTKGPYVSSVKASYMSMDPTTGLPHNPSSWGWAYQWPEYFKSKGKAFGVNLIVRRFDTKKGKIFTPYTLFQKKEDEKVQWLAKAPNILYSLYVADPNNFYEKMGATVLVFEGEKDALISQCSLKDTSFLAVGFHGGAGNENLTDWSPLCGRDVIFCPDNDTAGTNSIPTHTALAEIHNYKSFKVLNYKSFRVDPEKKVPLQIAEKESIADHWGQFPSPVEAYNRVMEHPGVPKETLKSLLDNFKSNSSPKGLSENSPLNSILLSTLDEILESKEMDPTNFGDYDLWITVCTAFIAAAGDSSEVKDKLTNWSLRDPEYAEKEDLIRDRLEPLTPQGSSGKAPIGPATLLKILKDQNVSVELRNKVYTELYGEIVPLKAIKDSLARMEKVRVKNSSSSYQFPLPEEKLQALTGHIKAFYNNLSVGSEAEELCREVLKGLVFYLKIEDRFYINPRNVWWTEHSSIRRALHILLLRCAEYYYEKVLLCPTDKKSLQALSLYWETVGNSSFLSSLERNLKTDPILDGNKIKWDSAETVDERGSSTGNPSTLPETLTFSDTILDYSKDSPYFREDSGEFRYKSMSFKKSDFPTLQDMTYETASQLPKNTNKLLSDMFPDEETCQTAWECLASVVSGSSAKYRTFQIWTGVGRNGKSILIDLLSTIFGDKCCQFNPEVIMSGATPGRFSAELATFQGALCSIASETPSGGKVSQSLIKLLTGDRNIRGEAKYKTPSTFTSSHQLILATNFPPEFDSMDSAFKDRVLVLPFKSIFCTNEEDRKERLKRGDPPENLKDSLPKGDIIKILAEEKSKILLKLIFTYLKMKKKGGDYIFQSEACKEAKKAYIAENSSLQDFLKNTFEYNQSPSCSWKTSNELLLHTVSESFGTKLNIRALVRIFRCLPNWEGVGSTETDYDRDQTSGRWLNNVRFKLTSIPEDTYGNIPLGVYFEESYTKEEKLEYMKQKSKRSSPTIPPPDGGGNSGGGTDIPFFTPQTPPETQQEMIADLHNTSVDSTAAKPFRVTKKKGSSNKKNPPLKKGPSNKETPAPVVPELPEGFIPRSKEPQVFPPLPEDLLSISVETHEEKDTLKFGPGSHRHYLENENSYILGVAISDTKKDYYFHSSPELFTWLNSICDKHTWVGHNILEDLSWLNYEGFNPKQIIDSLGMLHLLDENREGKDPYGLHTSSLELSGTGKSLLKPIESLHSNKIPGNPLKLLRHLPFEILSNFAKTGARAIYSLYTSLLPKISEQKLGKVWETEYKILPLLAKVHHKGVRVNQSLVPKISESLEEELKAVKADLFRLAEKEFNPLDEKDRLEIFDRLSLPYKLKENGHLSFKHSDLLPEGVDLNKEYLPHLLVFYEELSKLKTVFVDKLPDLSVKGRIHLLANPYGAQTGELFTLPINLSRFPEIKGEELFYKLFLPEEGEILASSKYNSQEGKELAHYAAELGFPEYKKKYLEENYDIYTEISLSAGITRKTAKTIALATIFGVEETLLAQNLGVEEPIAQDIIKNFHTNNPVFKTVREHFKSNAITNGYVLSKLGRRRRLSEEKALKAFSSVVQGNFADFAKLTLVESYEAGLFDTLNLLFCLKNQYLYSVSPKVVLV